MCVRTALRALSVGGVFLAIPGLSFAASVQILEEGKTLSSSIAEQFAETRACPKNDGDIEKLKELSKLYDAKPFPVDISELTVIPLDASSPGREAHLPVSCGYNTSSHNWQLRSTRATIPTRYVPVATKRALFSRAASRCEYVHPATKRRCEETRCLQIEHIVPYAFGGATEASNLEVLCANHNRLRAIQAGISAFKFARAAAIGRK